MKEIPKLSQDRGLTRTEIKKLMDQPHESLPFKSTEGKLWRADRDKLLIALLYETWARIDELLSVRIEDIDFDNMMITLENTKRKSYIEGDKRISVQKSRMVDYGEKIRADLMRHIGNRKTGYLFRGRNGMPLSKRAARKKIHRYAVEAGIQRCVPVRFTKEGKPVYKTRDGRSQYLIHPHSIREAGEAHAIIDGMNPHVAAQRAGHTIEVQQKSYWKQDALRSKEAMEKIRRVRGE